MKLRPRILVFLVLGSTLVSALAAPDGPPGARRLAGWSLRPLMSVASKLRLLRLGDGGGGDEAEAWRRAYLQEHARYVRLREELRAIPDLRGYGDLPAALEALEERRPLILTAPTLLRDATPLRHGILVEAGEEDDVVPGLPVTVDRALVGVVVRVWSGSVSQVRLLDDPQMRLRVAVLVEGAEEGAEPVLRPGNLEGLGGGRLAMRFVRGPGIEVGATVVTTAEDWWIPPYLVIGTVSEVTDHDHDGVSEVRVSPAAPLTGIGTVAIWRRADPPPGPWTSR